jgi:ferredoxin--NADP+ reductase
VTNFNGVTMVRPGTPDTPLRVAIIGSGPAGFYAAEHLLKRDGVTVEVDMFDRLPTPFGLVRYGVAPDHQKIKNVVRVFEKVASRPGFRFYGNVEIGTHLSLDELRRHYHQVCFATGAQTDRRMGIPGEDLERSHPATDFVAWYNGHPDYVDREFDLSVERIAVVGIGNVAVDVARVLCRTPAELATTDIADHALAALRDSRVREVHMLGRRGPAQAAFTNAEIKELGELEGADVVVRPDEVTLDALSQEYVEHTADATLTRKVEILAAFAGQPRTGKPRTLTLRLLVSPVELLDDGAGAVRATRLVKNRLYRSDDSSLRPKPTDQFEELQVDTVFRSVGYHGVPVGGLPFDEWSGTIPNEVGRVVEPETGETATGLYVSGWIKRGPSGVIGTNKPDAAETVAAMLEDHANDRLQLPEISDSAAIGALVAKRQPGYVSFEDWRSLDRLEVERGGATGRPRVKFTSVGEMLTALGRGLT